LLAESDLPLASSTTASDRIDFGAAHAIKESLLRKTINVTQKTTDTNLRSAFETFAQKHARWLEDYALFRALKDAHGGVAWNKWETPVLVALRRL
jgi:4-alpha-glucanotransferase